MNPHVALASLSRGGWEEVTHYGEIVVYDDRGALWSASEAWGMYPMRSLLKPFQFLACRLPDERWKTTSLESTRYAACVGSVSATTEQVQILDAWYRKGKSHALVDQIQVPPTVPLDAEKRIQAKILGPKPLYHMCFSKHAAIVEACEAHGWDPKTYLSQSHPFHRSLVDLLSEFLGRDLSRIPFAVDGCHLPTPVLSLSEQAKLYQRLAAAGDTEPLGWVRRMMLANPDWIGGPDRTDTKLMKANPGKLVAKEGADGLFGVAVLPTERHPRGLGIVVKLAGGFDMKAAALCLGAVLESLGLEGVHTVSEGQLVRWPYRPFEVRAPSGFDISPRVSEKTAVWPGDQRFSRKVSLDTQKGDHLSLSSITTTVHIGAHTDAPNHYEKSDRGIDAVDWEKYRGPCQVICVEKKRGTRIVPADLADCEIRSARVLFQTRSFPNPESFNEDFVALSGELVEWLAEKGVRLVGIDTPSIDLFDSKDLPAHHATLKTGVAVLEGIVLEGVDEGVYRLSALPLKLHGADASPVRAVLD